MKINRVIFCHRVTKSLPVSKKLKRKQTGVLDFHMADEYRIITLMIATLPQKLFGETK
jgi:hypothetical protein